MKKKKTVAFAPVLEHHQTKPPVVVKKNIIEDVVLLLNPTYLPLYDEMYHYLHDIGFYVIDRDLVTISARDARDLIEKRFRPTKRCEDIIDHFSTVESAFFHVSCLNAYDKVDVLLKKYFTSWDDYFNLQEMQKPYTEKDFANFFLPCDSPDMYEASLKLVWPEGIEYWGQDVVRAAKVVRERIINRIIQTTVSDSIQRELISSDLMITQFYHNPKETKAVHYTCWTSKQGRFEIRIQNKYGSMSGTSKIKRKRMRYLDKFHSLSMYYTKLCNLTDDLCPSFYRFRISPDATYKLSRVFEVEEYCGEQFMFQILREVEEFRKHEVSEFDKMTKTIKTKQGSLVAYSYGFKLAKMAEQLSQIKFNEITEVGKIRFDKGEFIGSTHMKDFYLSEKEYFYGLLDDVKHLVDQFFSKRYNEFMDKIEDILESKTFKESRKADKIRLIPDRIDPINIRIYNKSEFVTDYFLQQLETKLNTDIENIAREKYFQGISGGLDYTIINKFERLKKEGSVIEKDSNAQLEDAKIDFRNSKEGFNKRLGSFYNTDMDALQRQNKLDDTLSMRTLTNKYLTSKNSDFPIPEETIVKSKQDVLDKKGVAITGIEPAKYTKEHWAASIYFFINFIMPEMKRRELMDSNILSNPLDFDDVIKTIATAFMKNYTDFEKGHKLPEFLDGKSDLERFQKELEHEEKQMKKTQAQEEEYKRYLRCISTPEEALELVADEMRQK